MTNTKPERATDSARLLRQLGALTFQSARTWARLSLGMALLSLVSACQLADMARYTYDNANATHHWDNTQHTTQHRTSVPFTLIDNHIVLPVRVNGSEPLNFVLDSGAAATVILESRGTRALHLALAGEMSVSGAGTGHDPVAHIVRDTEFSLGDISLRGHSAIYLPLDSIPFFDDLDHVYFDGVIGAPFFSRFLVEIDYDRQLVSFSEPSTQQQKAGASREGWSELPLEIEGGVPYATVQVDNERGETVEVKLLVDTGFRGAVSLTPSSHDQLQEPREYFQSVSAGLSGDVISHVAMSESLTLAGYTVQHLPIGYAISGGEEEADSNGLLGNELLQQFNLVFDYANERLLLASNQSFAAPINADRSGLEIRPHVEGGIVKRIAPGSAGEEGALQVSDIITAFDGEPVSHQNIAELKRALASGRDSVPLCWVSADVERCETVVLASRFVRKPEFTQRASH
jgi:hypothetical protein